PPPRTRARARAAAGRRLPARSGQNATTAEAETPAREETSQGHENRHRDPRRRPSDARGDPEHPAGGRVSALHQDAQLPLERHRPAVQRPAQVLRGAVRGAQRVRRRGRGARAKVARLTEGPGAGPAAKDMIATLLADHEAGMRSLRADIGPAADTYQDIGTSDDQTGLRETPKQ